VNAQVAPAEELQGKLSADEAREQRRGSIEAIQIREHYDLMLMLTTRERNRLDAVLANGLARQGPGPSVHRATGYRLINSFAWANNALWRAAFEVCKLEHLRDEGVAEGIEWEVKL
jgi:hypothetical protein